MHAVDRNAAILWAREVLANPSQYYILDTETTGLNSPEIIELAVMDLKGQVIINQRFNPKNKVEAGAAAIHGLTNEILLKYPRWDVIADRIEQILLERNLLIYNFGFDYNALWTTHARQDRTFPDFRGDCVMQQYSQFIGEWHNYHHNYRWQKLPGGDHSALGDCLATLAVIEEMAAADIRPIGSIGINLLELEDLELEDIGENSTAISAIT
jgi:DNA polymerase III subunit epsilon